MIQVSLTGSILILLVLAVRPLLRKGPREFPAAAWLLPFGRLLLPYTTLSLPLPELPTGLWLGGVAALMVYAVLSTLYLYRYSTGGVEYEDRVFVHDTIPFPFTLGRRIYMPFLEEDHRRRWLIRSLRQRSTVAALAVRMAVFAAAAIHWFNPLIWVALWLCRRDWDAYHDARVLEQSGLLPCEEGKAPLWLGLNPWAALITGVSRRKENCESRMQTPAPQKLPAMLLSVVVAAVALITLIPAMPAETSETADEPVQISGNYYSDHYAYRSPFALGLMEQDGLRYEFKDDSLTVLDRLTEEPEGLYSLKDLTWQENPYTKSEWGRLLWWVEESELPYLDGQYASLGNGAALIRTDLGLYFLRGKPSGGKLSEIISICSLTQEETALPQLHTTLPQGKFVSQKCVATPLYESSIPGDDSGYLYSFEPGSVKLTERRNGALSELPILKDNWKHLFSVLEVGDRQWMANILGGYDALQQASFNMLSQNRYLILSGDKLYMGHGWASGNPSPVNCGYLYLLQEAPASVMPSQGHSLELTPAIYWTFKTYFGNEKDYAAGQYFEIGPSGIQVWYGYNASLAFPYDPNDAKWTYFPKVTDSVGSKYVICLSDAYVRKLNNNEFLLKQGVKLTYGIGKWDEDTGWLQIQMLIELERTLFNPNKPK